MGGFGKMKVLVLGGSGQIGEPLCDYLRKCSHEVINVDLKNGPENDLRSNQLHFDTYFNWCDFVFFLAFDVGGSTYLKKYEQTKQFLDNNIKIMKTVFDKLDKWKKPFVFASSQMSNMNHSPYGVLKRIGEFYTRSLQGVNVKFWNVYGVESDPEKTHVITDFIKQASSGDKIIRMKTNGKEERQFLYTDDCSYCLHSIMQTYDFLDKDVDFCVTSFEWNSILDVAKCVCELFPGSQYYPSVNEDSVQAGFRNEPTTEIIELFGNPVYKLKDGIKKVAIDMGVLK